MYVVQLRGREPQVVTDRSPQRASSDKRQGALANARASVGPGGLPTSLSIRLGGRSAQRVIGTRHRRCATSASRLLKNHLSQRKVHGCYVRRLGYRTSFGATRSNRSESFIRCTARRVFQQPARRAAIDARRPGRRLHLHEYRQVVRNSKYTAIGSRWANIRSTMLSILSGRTR